MAHFATIDNSTNKVIRVEVINNAVITDSFGVEQEQLGIEFLISLHRWEMGVTYKKTSYNHNIRKNFATVGGTYDVDRDAFIDPRPVVRASPFVADQVTWNSWVLNDTTCRWEAPSAYPTDGKPYTWDESTTSWAESKESRE